MALNFAPPRTGPSVGNWVGQQMGGMGRYQPSPYEANMANIMTPNTPQSAEFKERQLWQQIGDFPQASRAKVEKAVTAVNMARDIDAFEAMKEYKKQKALLIGPEIQAFDMLLAKLEPGYQERKSQMFPPSPSGRGTQEYPHRPQGGYEDLETKYKRERGITSSQEYPHRPQEELEAEYQRGRSPMGGMNPQRLPSNPMANQILAQGLGMGGGGGRAFGAPGQLLPKAEMHRGVAPGLGMKPPQAQPRPNVAMESARSALVDHLNELKKEDVSGFSKSAKQSWESAKSVLADQIRELEHLAVSEAAPDKSNISQEWTKALWGKPDIGEPSEPEKPRIEFYARKLLAKNPNMTYEEFEKAMRKEFGDIDLSVIK